MADAEEVIENLEEILPDITDLLQQLNLNLNSNDANVIQTCLRESEKAQELLSCFISVLSQPIFQHQVYEDITVKLEELLTSLDRYRTHYESSFNSVGRKIRHSLHDKVNVVHSGNVGRPSVVIDEEQIAGLRSLRMSWTKIAELLGISVETLRRKRQLFLADYTYETMSDNELDDVVRDLLQKHPCAGERLLQRHLMSNGHFVQKARVKESLSRIDPNRTSRFNKRRVFRIIYNVPEPNYLW